MIRNLLDFTFFVYDEAVQAVVHFAVPADIEDTINTQGQRFVDSFTTEG